MESKGKSAVKELLENNVFSVSAYLKLLNGILNSFQGRIKGEVSEVKIAASGHVYFSLKDKKDQSVLSCVIWNYDYKMCGLELREGLEIIAFGAPDVYPPTGRLSFKAKTVQLVGEGELKKEYERLKAQLEAEGIFAEERKRPLPAFPKKIGIITSRQGAVISDFLNNIGRFGFEIKFIDSRVEGLEAVSDLMRSVRTMKGQDVDLLVVMRGGGSLESFLAFNNEALIREIKELPFPVIAALGHDKDVPLLALAADAMVSTPTAAANLINRSWQEAEIELKDKSRDILSLFEKKFNEVQYRLTNIFMVMRQRLEAVIADFRMTEYRITEVIPRLLENRLGEARSQLREFERIISQNDPRRNLRLGYCIAVSKGKIVRKTADTAEGEALDLKVYDGTIITKITKIKHEGKKS